MYRKIYDDGFLVIESKEGYYDVYYDENIVCVLKEDEFSEDKIEGIRIWVARWYNLWCVDKIEYYQAQVDKLQKENLSLKLKLAEWH